MGDAIEAAGAVVRRVVGWEMMAVALVVLVRVVIKRISVGGSAMAVNAGDKMHRRAGVKLHHG